MISAHSQVVILLMLTGGEALERMAFERAQTSLTGMLIKLQAAETAVVRRDRNVNSEFGGSKADMRDLRWANGGNGGEGGRGVATEECIEEVEVAAVDVVVGDTVVVRPGQRVPVDGVLVSRTCVALWKIGSLLTTHCLCSHF